MYCQQRPTTIYQYSKRTKVNSDRPPPINIVNAPKSTATDHHRSIDRIACSLRSGRSLGLIKLCSIHYESQFEMALLTPVENFSISVFEFFKNDNSTIPFRHIRKLFGKNSSCRKLFESSEKKVPISSKIFGKAVDKPINKRHHKKTAEEKEQR